MADRGGTRAVFPSKTEPKVVFFTRNPWDVLPVEGDCDDDEASQRGVSSDQALPKKTKANHRVRFALEREEDPEDDYDSFNLDKTEDIATVSATRQSAPAASASPTPSPAPAPSPAASNPNQSKQMTRKRQKGRALDLFSGTGSVANRLRELGYQVTTLDFLPKNNPDIVTDLIEWDYKQFPPGI